MTSRAALPVIFAYEGVHPEPRRTVAIADNTSGSELAVRR
jgi:hypothetical protein